MNDVVQLALTLLAGGGLGILFFGGLWWTVQKALVSPRPALWFFGSLALRTGIVLGGFYVVAGSDWRWWLACLAGFALARLVVIRFTRRLSVSSKRTITEAHHAP
ncbi:MAG TPA: ATP synthase subunit I [Gallionella sp.]|nr:ATP synthase subunit I [Gallionella sp.]